MAMEIRKGSYVSHMDTGLWLVTDLYVTQNTWTQEMEVRFSAVNREDGKEYIGGRLDVLTDAISRGAMVVLSDEQVAELHAAAEAEVAEQYPEALAILCGEDEIQAMKDWDDDLLQMAI